MSDRAERTFGVHPNPSYAPDDPASHWANVSPLRALRMLLDGSGVLVRAERWKEISETMPKPSKWKAAHVKCQQAVDDVKASLTAEIEQLRQQALIADGVENNLVDDNNRLRVALEQIRQEVGTSTRAWHLANRALTDEWCAALEESQT